MMMMMNGGCHEPEQRLSEMSSAISRAPLIELLINGAIVACLKDKNKH